MARSKKWEHIRVIRGRPGQQAMCNEAFVCPAESELGLQARHEDADCALGFQAGPMPPAEHIQRMWVDRLLGRHGLTDARQLSPGGACLMQLLQQLAHARAQEQAQPHGEVLQGTVIPACGKNGTWHQQWNDQEHAERDRPAKKQPPHQETTQTP